MTLSWPLVPIPAKGKENVSVQCISGPEHINAPSDQKIWSIIKFTLIAGFLSSFSHHWDRCVSPVRNMMSSLAPAINSHTIINMQPAHVNTNSGHTWWEECHTSWTSPDAGHLFSSTNIWSKRGERVCQQDVSVLFVWLFLLGSCFFKGGLNKTWLKSLSEN